MTGTTDKRQAWLDATAALDVCAACGGPIENWHHIVPETLGGTVTVPLCEECHDKAHERTLPGLAVQTRQRRRERGEWEGGTNPFGFRLVSVARDGGRRRHRCVRDVGGELEIVKLMWSLYREHGTIAAVGSALRARGISGRNGGEWPGCTIVNAMARRSNGTLHEKVAASLHRYGPHKPKPVVPPKPLLLTPYGCRRAKKGSEAFQDAMALALRCRDAGMTLDETGDELLRNGLYPPQSNRWSLASVYGLRPGRAGAQRAGVSRVTRNA